MRVRLGTEEQFGADYTKLRNRTWH